MAKIELTAEEAQNLSQNGIAILGNPLMKEIVWEKNSPYPKSLINNKLLLAPHYRNLKGWIPDNIKNNYES